MGRQAWKRLPSWRQPGFSGRNESPLRQPPRAQRALSQGHLAQQFPLAWPHLALTWDFLLPFRTAAGRGSEVHLRCGGGGAGGSSWASHLPTHAAHRGGGAVGSRRARANNRSACPAGTALWAFASPDLILTTAHFSATEQNGMQPGSRDSEQIQRDSAAPMWCVVCEPGAAWCSSPARAFSWTTKMLHS